MSRLRRLILTAAIAWASGPLHAAMVVADLTTLTPGDLVNLLLGAGVTSSGVSYVGDNSAAGEFSGGLAAVGFDKGVLLSSGQVLPVAQTTAAFLLDADFASVLSDPDLNALSAPFSTYDVASLEFDFVPLGPQLKFEFVFSSEEYNEFANSSYNDVFGFFVNGVNVAVVPATTQPISINTINLTMNPAYYFDNEGNARPSVMDGFTVVLTAAAVVNPGVTNHIKIAIADASDNALDSVVFIKAASFSAPPPTATSTPVLTSTPTFTATLTATNSTTWSHSPTSSHTPSITLTPTPSPTFTQSPTWSHTPTDSVTPTVTPSSTITSTCTTSMTASITPTWTVSPTVTVTVTQTPRPLQLKLLPPNPNPSDGSGQWLPYFLSTDARTDITVYTVAGETVRRLEPRDDLAGYREQFWDNKNEAGRPVASGVFIYRVRARSARDEEKQDFSKCAVTR